MVPHFATSNKIELLINIFFLLMNGEPFFCGSKMQYDQAPETLDDLFPF